MKIMTEDGRVFDGTPEQIVQAMRTSSFHAATTDEDYMAWATEMARTNFGAELQVVGATHAERAASFVAEMIRLGLVREGAKAPAADGQKGGGK